VVSTVTDAEQVLTVNDIARRLKITPYTVRTWLKRGRLVGFRAGPQQWRVTVEEYARFVANKDSAA
jgi:excisionase family DNA binding protein